MLRKLFLFSILFFISLRLSSQARWKIEPDGSILWKIQKGEAHSDNIEMSGKFISSIITYGVDEKGKLILSRQVVFPMLRTVPNDTHASLTYTFGQESSPVIRINNRLAQEQVSSVRLRGIVEIEGNYNGNIFFRRQIFPSTDKPAAIETYTLANKSGKYVQVDIENFEKMTWTHPEKSVYGVYELSAKVSGSGISALKQGDSLSFSVICSGRKQSEPELKINPDAELASRDEFVNKAFSNLKFICPDTVLSRLFDFSKIRAMESIYQTKEGPVHSPGGGAYYAAIWANDQAEYANPFFAYTGYPLAIEAGKNSWRWFAKYMNPEYKPIPSSIIAEGADFWNGAGDRGDMAMMLFHSPRSFRANGMRCL